ncbi:hypothetical protein [Sulfitobacter profundi]|uniref:Integrase n=1 Tax=Sulfitobacter profundi TaxID=2679961 RepID=A0ABW1Z1Q1_9RHOB
MFLKLHSLIRTDGNLAGERLPYLSGEGLDAYSMMWSAARRAQFTPNTRSTALNCLIPMRLWSVISGVNVEREMVFGSCLSHEQVEDMLYYIGLKRKDLATLTIARPADLNRFLSACEPVSAGTENLRRIYINNYLMWLGSYGNLVLQKPGKLLTI